jgi:hypothetical protein
MYLGSDDKLWLRLLYEIFQGFKFVIGVRIWLQSSAGFSRKEDLIAKHKVKKNMKVDKALNANKTQAGTGNLPVEPKPKMKRKESEKSLEPLVAGTWFYPQDEVRALLRSLSPRYGG